jgi:hypothetical protein
MFFEARRLTVGAVEEDYKTVYDVEFVTYTVESADFTSFVVGYADDFTRLYTISTGS